MKYKNISEYNTDPSSKKAVFFRFEIIKAAAVTLILSFFAVCIPFVSRGVQETTVIQSGEPGVDFEITLKDGTVGEYYSESTTAVRLVTLLLDEDDEDYEDALEMAQLSKVSSAISVKKGETPPGLIIANNEKQATFTGTPMLDGSYTFYVSIPVKIPGQPGLTFVAKSTIKINPAKPLPPEITEAPQDEYTIEEGEKLDISVSSNCYDGVDYSLYIDSSGVYKKVGEQKSSLSWSFNPAALSEKSDLAGEYKFRITAANARDNTKTTDVYFTLKINEKPKMPTPPVITGKADYNAGETAEFSAQTNTGTATFEWLLKRKTDSEFKAVGSGALFTLSTTVYDDGAELKCLAKNTVGEAESETLTLAITKPHTHSFGEYTVTKAPGCTTNGIETAYCECGAETERIIQAPGHVFSGEWTTETEPGCTTEGIKSHRCTVCGEKNDITPIPQLGHTYGEWIVRVMPTYASEGSESRECSVCGDMQTRTVPKLVEGHTHSFTEWKVTTPASCTATGLKTAVCSCGETKTEIIPALEHLYGAEYEIIKPASCSEEGSKAKKCVLCGALSPLTVIPKTPHIMGAWVITKTPTETEEGIKTSTCSLCGYTETQSVAKVVDGHEHIFGIWYTSVNATCTENGEDMRICAICGMAEKKVTLPLGHSYGAWYVGKEPTCEENGEEKRVCKVCADTQSEIISKKGHSFGEWTITVNPSESKDGVEERVCKTCGKTEERAIDHTGLPITEKPGETATVTPSETEPDETKTPETIPDATDSNNSKAVIIIIAVVVLLVAICGMFILGTRKRYR